jgi:hypothetical protein
VPLQFSSGCAQPRLPYPYECALPPPCTGPARDTGAHVEGRLKKGIEYSEPCAQRGRPAKSIYSGREIRARWAQSSKSGAKGHCTTVSCRARPTLPQRRDFFHYKRNNSSPFLFEPTHRVFSSIWSRLFSNVSFSSKKHQSRRRPSLGVPALSSLKNFLIDTFQPAVVEALDF